MITKELLYKYIEMLSKEYQNINVGGKFTILDFTITDMFDDDSHRPNEYIYVSTNTYPFNIKLKDYNDWIINSRNNKIDSLYGCN